MAAANVSSWHSKVRALYEHWLSIHPGGGRLPSRDMILIVAVFFDRDGHEL